MENLSPYKVHSQEPPNLSHLRILGSTVYVLLHEEERLMKSEKWAPRALKGVLVGYDGHTIYRVYIKDQKKVIRVKDLRIFEDYETKKSTDLPDYDERPTFQGFLFEDNDEGSEKESSTCAESRKVTSTKGKTSEIDSRAGQNAQDARAIKPTPIPARADQKAQDARAISTARASQKAQDARATSTARIGQNAKDARANLLTACTGQNAKDARANPFSTTHADQASKDVTKPRSGRTVKLSTKAREALTQEASHQDTPPIAGTEVENLVLYLIEMLNNWDMEEDKGERDMLVRENLELGNQERSEEEDPIMILATKINSVNATDYDQFVCATQFDIEEPETYAGAKQGPYAAQWAKAMEEELDQLLKNET